MCTVIGGNPVRNSGSNLCILLRIVLAAYSCLSDATHTGTILCASTFNEGEKKEEGGRERREREGGEKGGREGYTLSVNTCTCVAYFIV